MATDYRKLCIELFGTDNVAELRRIAGKQKTGRKKSLTEKDIQKIIDRMILVLEDRECETKKDSKAERQNI